MKTRFPFPSFSGVEKQESSELGVNRDSVLWYTVMSSAQYYRLHWRFVAAV